jgi:hypothetical protein
MRFASGLSFGFKSSTFAACIMSAVPMIASSDPFRGSSMEAVRDTRGNDYGDICTSPHNTRSHSDE